MSKSDKAEFPEWWFCDCKSCQNKRRNHRLVAAGMWTACEIAFAFIASMSWIDVFTSFDSGSSNPLLAAILMSLCWLVTLIIGMVLVAKSIGRWHERERAKA